MTAASISAICNLPAPFCVRFLSVVRKSLRTVDRDSDRPVNLTRTRLDTNDQKNISVFFARKSVQPIAYTLAVELQHGKTVKRKLLEIITFTIKRR